MDNEHGRSAVEGLGANALISAAVSVHQDGDRDDGFARYRRLRYDLLRGELGVAWDLLEGRVHDSCFTDDRRYLPGLLKQTIAILAQPTNPFGRYLEAPKLIIEAYERHNEQLGRAGTALRGAQRDLALDLLSILEPDLDSRATSHEALREAGLPEYPAPSDEDYD